MEGDRPAADDASGPSQRSGKRRRATSDDDDGRDGVNGMPEVAPLQPDRVPGRGDGGENGLGVIIRDPSPVRQNPVPLQSNQDGLNGMLVVALQAQRPDRRVLGRGNGGEDGLSIIVRDLSLVRQNPIPVNNQATGTPSHWINPGEALRKYMDEVQVRYVRQQVLAGQEHRVASILRTSAHILRNVRNQTGMASSSSQPVQQKTAMASLLSQPTQQRSDDVPRYYSVSVEDYRRGWNMLVETTRENAQLRAELAAREKECASLREALVQANERATLAEAAVALTLLGAPGARRRAGAGLVGELNPMCLLCGLRPASVVLRPCEHRCLCNLCYIERRLVCPSCRVYAW